MHWKKGKKRNERRQQLKKKTISLSESAYLGERMKAGGNIDSKKRYEKRKLAGDGGSRGGLRHPAGRRKPVTRYRRRRRSEQTSRRE